jgi:hypothetical protein
MRVWLSNPEPEVLSFLLRTKIQSSIIYTCEWRFASPSLSAAVQQEWSGGIFDAARPLSRALSPSVQIVRR